MRKPADVSPEEWQRVLEQAKAWKWRLVGSRYIGMGVREVHAVDERHDEHRIIAVTMLKPNRL